MTFILIILIGAILSGIVSLFFSSEMLVGLYDVVFNSGITMQTITGVEFFGLIMPISYGVGISLIILKFLKKAFDPFLLLTNFVRAVGTALIFQWLYGLFVDIFRDITNTIIDRINSNCNPTVEWVNSITSLGIVPAICGLIFIICYLILLLSFMARGVEMMVMRIGVPLACVGLLDNDKGVFRAYINQFVKAFIVQIMLCKIGLSLMLNSTMITGLNIFWGIACMIAAISMPKILREFLVPTGGDGHIGNTVFQTVHVASLAKSVFTK